MTPIEGAMSLEVAASYLKWIYYSTDCERNDGWDNHELERITHLFLQRKAQEIRNEINEQAAVSS